MLIIAKASIVLIAAAVIPILFTKSTLIVTFNIPDHNEVVATSFDIFFAT